MILGTPKFTGIVLGQLTVDKLSKPTIQITAKAAFIDPNTGNTYGWTTAEGALWSKETLEQLNSLLVSMEQDIARVHFGDGGYEAPAAVAPAAPATPKASGGLGEHVGSDPPSI